MMDTDQLLISAIAIQEPANTLRKAHTNAMTRTHLPQPAAFHRLLHCYTAVMTLILCQAI
jgi:hypothetical protein